MTVDRRAGHGAGHIKQDTERKKLDDVSVSAPRHGPHHGGGYLSVVILHPTRALVSSHASKAGDRAAHPHPSGLVPAAHRPQSGEVKARPHEAYILVAASATEKARA
ncbi:hypothetical protein B0H16DRAFT_1734657 [Mycena metata]|uniref:Uncharacterized protein n=1 Tax=Mycena metata TaxID=1033252 RepID=A0AAD7HVW3_9AGAR|nr:hypothetical protein B0H16DRAFT_1734657 [Mycena metata]